MNLYPKDAEIVIGIVARIGVDTKLVTAEIRGELEQYRYKVFDIHVTDLLRGFGSKFDIVSSPSEERYKSLIAACNKMREDAGTAVMATLAIMDIFSQRSPNEAQQPAQERNAFLINQIKRPEEFDLLRKVYGEHYIQISCHADEIVRIDRLISKISDDHPEDPKSAAWDIKARELVHTDESEEGEKFGQRVRQVFPLADVIIDASSTASVIPRFFRALFGDHRVTPTKEEYGMELANTTSQRSSDASRQVGAAILSPKMEVRAVGCNEVPKAHGGAYWEGDRPDGREFAMERDHNEQRRRAVLIDLMIRLGKAEATKPEFKGPEKIKQFLDDPSKSLIGESQLTDSLEYGRSVHAEMSAITDAARVGIPVEGCVLYSNTSLSGILCVRHI
jgi:cytidine deaminase